MRSLVRHRRALAAAATLAPVIALGITGGSAGAASGPTPIASKLANPRQIAVDGNGNLVVALPGSGAFHATHKGPCSNGPEGPSCTGDSGGIEQIRNPATSPSASRVQYGLMSTADKGAGAQDPPGSAATGLDTVAFDSSGTEWGIFTYVPPAALKGLPSWVKNEDGKLVKIVNGVIEVVADIGKYSLARPNAGHPPDSDPYGLLVVNGTLYLTDAANNTLLSYKNGKITTLHVFPYRHGNGSDGSFDTVPTSIATDGKGHLFVGTLASFEPGQAKVYEMSLTGKVIKTISGLSQVTSVAVGPAGYVWVTEIFGGQQAPFGKNGPNGLVVAISPSGHRTTMNVPLPGGLAITGGHVYVSAWSISATTGAVWRIR